MTKIKLCGLSRSCDIEAANELKPDYIGFVLAPKSRRYVSPALAAELKRQLHPAIRAVGVFVDEDTDTILALLKSGAIDMAQLHGRESESDIRRLRTYTDKPIIKAFRMDSEQDVQNANRCSADFVLLDSGNGGTGTSFDWTLLSGIQRPYFLAGGLGVDNLHQALTALNPYAVDVSSGVETNGFKDKNKMAAFVAAVRKEETL